MVFKEEN